jgi:hypothetical protein
VVVNPSNPFRARSVTVKQGDVVYRNVLNCACPTAAENSSDFVVVPEGDDSITTENIILQEMNSCWYRSGVNTHDIMLDCLEYLEISYLVITDSKLLVTLIDQCMEGSKSFNPVSFLRIVIDSG